MLLASISQSQPFPYNCFNPLSIPINDASPQGNISKLHFPCLHKQTENTPQHGLRNPLELPLEDQVATSSSSIPTMLLVSSIQSFTTREATNENIMNGAFELTKDLHMNQVIYKMEII
ncbi:unnamed protein product [Sphagnum jensenii]|uniref:Uncharacterized protein n=1 Tax=Sphagnum jensenii TaxID=128206 RepID=A0ABP1BKT3_9BRYO